MSYTFIGSPPLVGTPMIERKYEMRTTSYVYNPTSNTARIELPTWRNFWPDLSWNSNYDVCLAYNGDALANGAQVLCTEYSNGHLYANLGSGIVSSIRIGVVYIKSGM